MKSLYGDYWLQTFAARAGDGEKDDEYEEEAPAVEEVAPAVPEMEPASPRPPAQRPRRQTSNTGLFGMTNKQLIIIAAMAGFIALMLILVIVVALISL